MSYEPTEELFDNLMKGLSNPEEECIYEDSDFECDNSEISSDNVVMETIVTDKITGTLLINKGTFLSSETPLKLPESPQSEGIAVNIVGTEAVSKVLSNAGELFKNTTVAEEIPRNISSSDELHPNENEEVSEVEISSLSAKSNARLIDITKSKKVSQDSVEYVKSPQSVTSQCYITCEIDLNATVSEKVESGGEVSLDGKEPVMEMKTPSNKFNSDAALTEEKVLSEATLKLLMGTPSSDGLVPTVSEVILESASSHQLLQEESIDVDSSLDPAVPIEFSLDSSASEDLVSVETIKIDVTQDEDDYVNGEKSNDEIYSDKLLEKQDFSTELNSRIDEFLNGAGNSSIKDISHSDSRGKNNATREDNTADKMLDNDSLQEKQDVNILSSRKDECEENLAKQDSVKYLKSLHIFSNITNEMKPSSDENVGTSASDGEDAEELNCRSFKCKGCGAIFWIPRFYYQHVSRETCKILYDCKRCNKKMKFTNPCLLKVHIESHQDSVDSIGFHESNLNLELPSIFKFEEKFLVEFQSTAVEKTLGKDADYEDATNDYLKCSECSERFPSLVKHLTEKSSTLKKCNTCDYFSRSNCSLSIHERLHDQKKPYCCPECGSAFVTLNNLVSHLSLVCYHFRRCNMSKCFICDAVMPDKKTLRSHMWLKHHSTIYKCSICPKRMFRFYSGLKVHFKESHDMDLSKNSPVNSIFHRCELCPGVTPLFPHLEYSNHIMIHVNDVQCELSCFKCITCGYFTGKLAQFQHHFKIKNVCNMSEHFLFRKTYPQISALKKRKQSADKSFLQVSRKKICSNDISGHIKSNTNRSRSQKTLRNTEESANKLPELQRMDTKFTNTKRKCLLCRTILDNSEEGRLHILDYHKCKDYEKYIQVLPPKYVTSMDESLRKTYTEESSVNHGKGSGDSLIRDPWACPSCDHVASSKEEFRSHLVEHREDGAYQCLECGECFVSQSPLEIHLVSAHSIKDTSSYISSNYVHNSFPKLADQPKQANQCSVCSDTFSDEKALHLHFRSHGLAFLRQNFPKKSS